MRPRALLLWLLVTAVLAPSGPATAGAAYQSTLLLSPAEVERVIATRAVPGSRIVSGLDPGAAGVTSHEHGWNALPATLPWTDLALELIVKYQQNPLRAARSLSYLHVAMCDALSVAQQSSLSPAAQRVAVHMVAAGVLELFYPQETEGRFMALATEASAGIVLGAHAEARHAWAIARAIVAAAKARATHDGADAVWRIADRPAPRPGLWEAAPPLYGYRPLEALAGQWKPWILMRADELPAPAPPDYGSDQYWAEAQKVLDTFRRLTIDQKKIADAWHLGQGTVTPAGVWNLKAKEIVLQQGLDTTETARLFALLNASMFDAFLACWDVKFRHWTERPVTAIRRKFDPSFLPHLVTPPFPSYVSGHATVSGAAAEVMAALFPAEKDRFDAVAEEAAQSRLYGGIHFESDNKEGLALGHAVGARVISRWPIKLEPSARPLPEQAERTPRRPTPSDISAAR